MAETPRVVRTERGTDVIVVSPAGDFDIDGADLLRRAFAESLTETRNRVVVDLAATTFLDSVALGTIMGAAKRAGASGGWLRLVAPPAYIQRVLHVTGLDVTFGVYDSVEEAVAAEVDSILVQGD